VDDIELTIRDAWIRLRDDVLANRDELRRRVIRMERPDVGRPLREWCLALRAGDTRLRGPLVDVQPASAVNPKRNGGHAVAHTVTITTSALRKLCAPVYLEGLTLDEAAARLGVYKQVLVAARVRGTIRCRYVEGLGGFWGKPRPVLHGEELDPMRRGFEPPDEALGYTALFDPQRVPEGIAQTLVRVPIERPRGPDYRDRSGLHPEHPLNDPGDDAPRKRPRLPPAPTQDIGAWYKWKGEEYIGYDWRSTNPRVKARYEAHQQKKALAREAQRRRYRERPPPSKSRGSIEFKGFSWLCPRCGKRGRVLYYPLAAINLLESEPRERAALRRAGVRAAPRPPRVAGFACWRCHGMRGLSRAPGKLRGFWNDLVAHLSGGLLYGREVARPAWISPVRKVAYHTHPGARPPLRRLAVQERLLMGWTHKRIAADLGIGMGTVETHVRDIYRQHRVHDRRALARQLGVKLMMKREQVGARLGAGQSYKQIAREMGISYWSVKGHARVLRRQIVSRETGVEGCEASSDRGTRRASPAAK
jgi:DNA-binding CsgD family transcriptional regulator